MTKRDCEQQSEPVDYIRLFKRMFEKIYEDAFEAYHRTPNHVSSKPYIERILRLAQAGLNVATTLSSRAPLTRPAEETS